MDEITRLCEIALALNGVITLIFTANYFVARKIYIAFTTALEKGINSVNISDINDEEPTYAVVRGKVKSLGPSIQSISKPDIRGVFQKLTIELHVVQRSNGIWRNVRNVIDTKYNLVPFAIVDGKYEVTITPLSDATFLHLPLIDNHFEPSNDSVLSLLFGLHQKGYQYTEYMLRENELLTGFGEAVKNQDGMQLVPPRNGYDFILSTMDPETIAAELNTNKKIYGYCVCVFGLLGACFAGILVYKWWRHHQDKKRADKLRKMEASVRVERQRNSARNEINDESFICVICFYQRREVVLLPCGHLIMCFDCAQACVSKPCAVCRRKVESMHLIYMT